MDLDVTFLGNTELSGTGGNRYTVKEGKDTLNQEEYRTFPTGCIFAEERKAMRGIGFSARVTDCCNLAKNTSLGGMHVDDIGLVFPDEATKLFQSL